MEYTSKSALEEIQFTNPHANGRVDLMTPPCMNQFELFKNPGENYNTKTASYNDALRGNIVDSTLSKVFFHEKNIQILQNGIRAGVFHMSNGEITVGPQDVTTLKIIMRSTFLQRASHDPNTDITKQIEILNSHVLEYCIHNVYNSAISYKKYIRDISTLPTPEDRPVNVSTKYNSVEFKKFF
jgi:hypothetical protein